MVFKHSAQAVVAAAFAAALEKELPVRPVVYLAGPLALAKDAKHIGHGLRMLCWEHGLDALWPSERYLYHPDEVSFDGNPIDVAEISHRSVFLHIEAAAAVIADISPFRGPQMDPTTAFEIGVAAAWKKPVFAWTSAQVPASRRPGHRRPSLFFERVFASGDARRARDGHWRDEQGDLIENLELVESAPIACSVEPVFCSAEEAIRCCAEYLRGNVNQAGKAHA